MSKDKSRDARNKRDVVNGSVNYGVVVAMAQEKAGHLRSIGVVSSSVQVRWIKRK